MINLTEKLEVVLNEYHKLRHEARELRRSLDSALVEVGEKVGSRAKLVDKLMAVLVGTRKGGEREKLLREQVGSARGSRARPARCPTERAITAQIRAVALPCAPMRMGISTGAPRTRGQHAPSFQACASASFRPSTCHHG